MLVGMAWERLQLPLPVADRNVASAETGWEPVEVYSGLAKGFVAGWALSSEGRWPIQAVYQLEGQLFRKFLQHSSPRLRWVKSKAKEPAEAARANESLARAPLHSVLEMARYLKYHLEEVAPLVAMAKKTSMCRCEMDGQKATKVMTRLCGEVQAWIHKEAAGMAKKPTGTSRLTAGMAEQMWLKILKVWSHFAREHLPYMLRPGSIISLPNTPQKGSCLKGWVPRVREVTKRHCSSVRKRYASVRKSVGRVSRAGHALVVTFGPSRVKSAYSGRDGALGSAMLVTVVCQRSRGWGVLSSRSSLLSTFGEEWAGK